MRGLLTQLDCGVGKGSRQLLIHPQPILPYDFRPNEPEDSCKIFWTDFHSETG